MKKIFLMGLALLVSGCSVKMVQPIDAPLVASVGDEIVSWAVPMKWSKSLVYNGVDDGTISVSYKEGVVTKHGLLDRGSASQNLKYDLNKSRQIAFQGIRLDVAEASNTEIRYRVLSGPREE